MIIAEGCLCIAAVVLRRWALTREGVGFPWSKNPGLHSASLKYWHVTNAGFHYSTRCSAILHKGELWTKPPATREMQKKSCCGCPCEAKPLPDPSARIKARPPPASAACPAPLRAHGVAVAR